MEADNVPVTWIDELGYPADVDSTSIADQLATKHHWESQFASSDQLTLFPRQEQREPRIARNFDYANYVRQVEEASIDLLGTRDHWEQEHKRYAEQQRSSQEPKKGMRLYENGEKPAAAPRADSPPPPPQNAKESVIEREIREQRAKEEKLRQERLLKAADKPKDKGHSKVKSDLPPPADALDSIVTLDIQQQEEREREYKSLHGLPVIQKASKKDDVGSQSSVKEVKSDKQLSVSEKPNTSDVKSKSSLTSTKSPQGSTKSAQGKSSEVKVESLEVTSKTSDTKSQKLVEAEPSLPEVPAPAKSGSSSEVHFVVGSSKASLSTSPELLSSEKGSSQKSDESSYVDITQSESFEIAKTSSLPQSKSSNIGESFTHQALSEVSIGEAEMRRSYKSDDGLVQNSGMNLIAREIEEQQKREAELRKHWKELGMESSYVETPEAVFGLHAHEDVGMKKLKDEQNTSHSHSVAQHSLPYQQEKPLEARAPRVHPLYDGIEEDILISYQPTNETAVEHEIRLAREREEMLRRDKGLPLHSNTSPSHEDIMVEVTSNIAGTNARRKTDKSSMKRLSTSLLQLELEREKQRELELKQEGNIKTTSDDFKADFKRYTEIMVDDSPPSGLPRPQPHTVQASKPLTPAAAFWQARSDDAPTSNGLGPAKRPSNLAKQLPQSQPSSKGGEISAHSKLPASKSSDSIKPVKESKSTDGLTKEQGNSAIIDNHPPAPIDKISSKDNLAINGKMSNGDSKLNATSPTIVKTKSGATLEAKHSAKAPTFAKGATSPKVNGTTVWSNGLTNDVGKSAMPTYKVKESVIDRELREMREREEELKKQHELVTNHMPKQPRDGTPGVSTDSLRSVMTVGDAQQPANPRKGGTLAQKWEKVVSS